MPVAKIAAHIDEQLLREIDRWVAAGEYSSRSGVVQAALTRLREERARRHTLLSELAKLDRTEEHALADEWVAAEAPWPQ